VTFMLCWKTARAEKKGPLSYISKDVAKNIMWRIQCCSDPSYSEEGRSIRCRLWGDRRISEIDYRAGAASEEEMYYGGADGVFLCYDITDPDRLSFDELGTWVGEIKKWCRNARVVVMGCKLDLAKERTVSAAEAKKWTEELQGIKAVYTESSAKTGEGVQEAFDMLIGLAMDNPDASLQYRIDQAVKEEKKRKKEAEESVFGSCLIC